MGSPLRVSEVLTVIPESVIASLLEFWDDERFGSWTVHKGESEAKASVTYQDRKVKW